MSSLKVKLSLKNSWILDARFILFYCNVHFYLKHLYHPWIFEAIEIFYFFNIGWSLKHISNFLMWINAWIMCSLQSPLNPRHLKQSNIYGFSMWVETFVTTPWTFHYFQCELFLVRSLKERYKSDSNEALGSGDFLVYNVSFK